MAKSLVVSLPCSALSKAIADFDVMGKSPNWVKLKVKEVLDGWLLSGCDKSFPLAPLDGDQHDLKLTMSVDGALEDAVMEISKQQNISAGECARRIIGLIAGQARVASADMHSDKSEHFIKILKESGFLEVRKEQVDFYLQNKETFNTGKIGLSEASTGTGKSISMLVCAAENVIETNSRVVISVPTIPLINQFKNTFNSEIKGYLSLKESIRKHLGSAPSIRAVYGKREFVSQAGLLELINNGEIESGYACLANEWLELATKTKNDPLFWLISSLESYIGQESNFPFDEVRLDATFREPDLGFAAYKYHLSAYLPQESEIVICSHAMLGVDFSSRMFAVRKDKDYQDIMESVSSAFHNKIAAKMEMKSSKNDKKSTASDLHLAKEELELKSSHLIECEKMAADRMYRFTEELGILPAYRYLMVDECHLFESSLSRVMSNNVSIRMIERELIQLKADGFDIKSSHIKQMKSAIKLMVDFNSNGQHDVLFLNNRSSLSGEIEAAVASIVDVLEKIPPPKKGTRFEALVMYRQLKLDLLTLKPVTKGAYGMVNYSPVKKFPQLTVGRPSMQHVLAKIWAFVDAASCVSATIYLPSSGAYKSWYMENILAIPEHRRTSHQPCISPWIIRPIKSVWQPETPEEIDVLTPPSTLKFKSENELAGKNDEWHASLSAVIQNKIIPNSVGGVLVLCTSYATCGALAENLKYNSEKNGYVIVFATQDFSLAKQKAVFLKASSEGKKVVWFATGSAWTGLDVSGKDIGLPAKVDQVITDLVIPRIPFNSNRSVTHKHRKYNNPSVDWERFDTSFVLRQGLGRAVRRQGLEANRVIWMLDSRLVGPDAKKYLIFQRVLETYKHGDQVKKAFV